MSENDRVIELRRPRQPERCPICRRPSIKRYRPFCSQRCADVDLGRWLRGGYRIETEEGPRESDAEEEEGSGAS